MGILGLIAVGLVGVAAGWAWGRGRAVARFGAAVAELTAELQGGGVGASGSSEVPILVPLRRELSRAWIPRPMDGQQKTTAEGALERVGAYLRTAVSDPLSKGLKSDEEGLRRGVRAALDAVDDLVFHAEQRPVLERGQEDLTRLVQDVMREFAAEFDTSVRLGAPDTPIRAPLDPEAFKDALYMLLVNAGRFGGEGAVEVTLEGLGGEVRLLVRDRGAGFSEDALQRAMEPFYSTDSGSLGMGLTHVRQVVLAHGGDITLRNREDGGGEVEILLPRS